MEKLSNLQLTKIMNNLSKQHKFTMYHEGKGYWYMAISGEIFSTNILSLKIIFTWISIEHVNIFAYKWLKGAFQKQYFSPLLIN